MGNPRKNKKKKNHLLIDLVAEILLPVLLYIPRLIINFFRAIF